MEVGSGIANGAGKWQGNMDREQLMGHGYIVGRGLLQARRGELSALLVAGRKAFNLTKDGHLRSSSARRSNCAWARVHAKNPCVGAMGARSIETEETLKAAPAPARRSAQRGLEVAQAAVGRRWNPTGVASRRRAVARI